MNDCFLNHYLQARIILVHVKGASSTLAPICFLPFGLKRKIAA